jgi:hypothetical protein
MTKPYAQVSKNSGHMSSAEHNRRDFEGAVRHLYLVSFARFEISCAMAQTAAEVTYLASNSRVPRYATRS